MAHFAGLQLGEQAVLLLRAALLRGRTLGQDEPIAPAVHLDDLEVERLAAHRAQLVLDLVLGAAAAQLDDLAERHEAAHAVDGDDQAALVVVDHLAGDDLFGVLLDLQITPADFGAGAIDRDDRPTVGVFGDDDNRGDVVSPLQRQLTPFVLDFTSSDDGFHLAADVDQDLVAIDEHDRALDQLTTPQLGVLRLFVLFEQCAHILGVVAELRVRLYVLFPGVCSCLLLGAFLRLVHSVQNELPTFALLLKLPLEYTGTCP